MIDARAPSSALAEDDARVVLLSTSDAEVTVVERPQGSLLVFDSHGHDLDFAMRLVAVAALVLTLLITILVVGRAAPKPLLLLPITWIVIAAFALGRARQHRRRFGRFELDAASGELRHAWHERPIRTLPLRAIRFASIEAFDDPDSHARGARLEQVRARWLELELEGGQRIRVARGRTWELRRVCSALADVGVEVR